MGDTGNVKTNRTNVISIALARRAKINETKVFRLQSFTEEDNA
jgi:hypothetical protein